MTKENPSKDPLDLLKVLFLGLTRLATRDGALMEMEGRSYLTTRFRDKRGTQVDVAALPATAETFDRPTVLCQVSLSKVEGEEIEFRSLALDSDQDLGVTMVRAPFEVGVSEDDLRKNVTSASASDDILVGMIEILRAHLHM